MKKQDSLKKVMLTGVALVASVISASAQSRPVSSQDLREGVLVSKDKATITVKECKTGLLLTLDDDASRSALVGDSVEFVYDDTSARGRLVASYPGVKGCDFFHS